MINSVIYGCAGTYLNSSRFPSFVTVNACQKERKVEDINPVHTGKKFNHNSGTKSNFASHIDICI